MDGAEHRMETWNLMVGAKHRKGETWYLMDGAEHTGRLGTYWMVLSIRRLGTYWMVLSIRRLGTLLIVLSKIKQGYCWPATTVMVSVKIFRH